MVGLALLSALLHAGWNVLAHRHRTSPALLFRIPLWIGLGGLVPCALAELADPLLSPRLIALVLATGAAQALYFLGLERAYRTSELSLAYPLSRALPVLGVALGDFARGRTFGALGLGGMALIVAGCAFSPRGGARPAFDRRAAGWIGLVVLTTVGYAMIDKIALEGLPARAPVALRFTVWEALATVPFLWAMRPRIAESAPSDGWTLAAAAMSFASYGLVLCAYQLSPQASYVVALRQVSIPLGVIASGVLLGEEVGARRVAASLAIAAGVGCVMLG